MLEWQKTAAEKRRHDMVAAVRDGHSLRFVARQFQVSLDTVQRWVERAEGKALSQVDWSDRSSAPQQVANRVSEAMEELVVQLREHLRKESALGE